MNNALKQKALGAMVAVIAFYAFAVGFWFFSAADAWKKSAKAYDRAKTTYQKEVKLIGKKRHWTDLYESHKAAMPTFVEGQATDTTWLKKMEEMAKKHLIVISQDKANAEIEAGDVLELPIEVHGWEGSLEALVKFMHELENTEEGMFALSNLNFKPSSKKGYLRGSFTLNCAYMRGEK